MQQQEGHSYKGREREREAAINVNHLADAQFNKKGHYGSLARITRDDGVSLSLSLSLTRICAVVYSVECWSTCAAVFFYIHMYTVRDSACVGYIGRRKRAIIFWPLLDSGSRAKLLNVLRIILALGGMMRYICVRV